MHAIPNRTRLAEALAALVRVPGLVRHDTWTRERLARHQAESLRRMISYASASSAFYARRFRELGIDPDSPLSAIPPIDKSTIIDHFDEIVTDPRLRLTDLHTHLDELDGDELYLGEYRVVSTGGTSGERMLMVYDRATWATAVASGLRTARFLGLELHGRRLRQATVTSASPQHLGSRHSSVAGLGLTSCLQLDPRMPTDQLCAALDEFRPDVLACYASVGVGLADAQLAGRMHIAPQAVVTTGEVRTEAMRETMTRAWGPVSFDAYATSETNLSGMECGEHRGIHLLEDLTILEIVDDDDQPVAPGQTGTRLLATNLVNRTLPLIRYVLTDMLTLAPEPCPCGRPFRSIREIVGRAEDTLRFIGHDGSIVEVCPFVVRSPIECTGGIQYYRVINEPDAMQVDLVLRPNTPVERLEALRHELIGELQMRGVARPQVRVRPVDEIERVGVGAKLKAVEDRSGLLA